MLKSKFGKWLRCHVGFRGAFLLFLGLLDVIYGWSMFTEGGATGLVHQITLFLPWQAWGILWIVVGASLLFGAFRWKDKQYFAVATSIKFLWAAFWFSAWYFDGVPRGWVSTIVWATFGMLVFIVSYWPEPRGVTPHPSEELMQIIKDHTPPEGIPAIDEPILGESAEER